MLLHSRHLHSMHRQLKPHPRGRGWGYLGDSLYLVILAKQQILIGKDARHKQALAMGRMAMATAHMQRLLRLVSVLGLSLFLFWRTSID